MSDYERKEKIDLSKIDELSYSCIMRELNKKCSTKEVLFFTKLFKEHFDNNLLKNLNDPERLALQNTLIDFNEKFPIKLSKNLTKNAAISELENAALVGKYISDIIKFILDKVPLDRREIYTNKVKSKIHALDEYNLSNKDMPASAAIGQSITFVKHVLFNQKPEYIKSVLNEIVSNL